MTVIHIENFIHPAIIVYNSIQLFFIYLLENPQVISNVSSISQNKDRRKRFDYLLKQTEIFSHFMTNQGVKASGAKAAAPATAPGTPKAKGRPKKSLTKENKSVDPSE